MEKNEIGMAVSGGGFRATLFHLGAFWRMNDMGYLKKAKKIPGLSRLSPEDQNKILFKNVKRLYKIKLSPSPN